MDRLDKECTVSLLQTRGEEATDKIEMRDAAVFPLYASAGLFGLYLFFKVFGDEGGVGINCMSLPSVHFSTFQRNMSISC